MRFLVDERYRAPIALLILSGLCTLYVVFVPARGCGVSVQDVTNRLLQQDGVGCSAFPEAEILCDEQRDGDHRSVTVKLHGEIVELAETDGSATLRLRSESGLGFGETRMTVSRSPGK